ncbi:hypothetical protein CEF21_20900 [Bacillus sp. FJAT-42376]|uniref:hypothetical protein n=1 Tax=Bacillus sp. FJAT-42376 TaxID=2014076 RepID=UPI000F5159EA|nr:hypothetical protein [Bacillus sp. FJAT-42376]AZB44545.1 hypothetical protein CEF21_20900 [Bacillus sp. FJAT-42376]
MKGIIIAVLLMACLAACGIKKHVDSSGNRTFEERGGGFLYIQTIGEEDSQKIGYKGEMVTVPKGKENEEDFQAYKEEVGNLDLVAAKMIVHAVHLLLITVIGVVLYKRKKIKAVHFLHSSPSS